MRIGVRILLGYLLVLAVLAAGLFAALPSIVRRVLQNATGPVLQEQAARLGERLGRVPNPEAFLRDIEGIVNADLVVTDDKGVVVYEALRPDSLRAVSRGRSPENLVGRRVPATVIAAAITEHKASNFPVTLFGQPVVAGVAPVTRSGNATGAVIAWRPYGFATQSERRVTTEVFTWLMAGLVLAALLSYLLTQGIVRRLRRVGDEARALAAGDLSVRVPEGTGDELGELGQSFNHMAARIQGLVEGLQKSERLRRELMASISHELRTPITSIQGFAEALRDGVVSEPEQQHRYHQIIAGESERLGRLVHDLFDFAKLEAGQFDFQLVAMDPRPWLSEFAERARARLEPGGLRLELTGDPGHEPILGDRQRLDQVLVNLVDNAARYSPPGGTIRLHVQPEAGGLKVSVQDQGPGIKGEDLPRVFDRYFQGSTPGNKAGGAGLGLAITRSIITGHGGEVGVTSEPGRGACFWFTVRRAPA